MKLILMITVALIVAAALSLAVVDDPGYVLIGYGNWSIETTLSLLVIIVLITFVISYYSIRFIVGLFRIPHAAREWSARRKSMQARKALNQGLMKLAEGNWKGAENQFIKTVAYSDSPIVNYLAAARAAQKLGAEDRRDRYLLAAHESDPNGEIAVGITKAELQMSNRELEQALTTLMHLRTIAPRNRHILEMLMRLYISLGDWDRLSELLPDLQKRKVIGGAQVDQLEREIHLNLLSQAAESSYLPDLKAAWGRLPRRLSRDDNLQIAYAGYLKKLSAEGDAEVLVRRALKRNWSSALINMYGQLEGADNTRQLAVAESWLKEHDKDPDLLLSLGRLAMRSQLWGKARGYLETSVGIAPSVEGYQLLANLLEQLEDPVEAAECYRKATLLASEAVPPSAAKELGQYNKLDDSDRKPALTAPA